MVGGKLSHISYDKTDRNQKRKGHRINTEEAVGLGTLFEYKDATLNVDVLKSWGKITLDEYERVIGSTSIALYPRNEPLKLPGLKGG